MDCINCGQGALVAHVTNHTTAYRTADGAVRELVVPQLRVLRCDSCGEEYLDDDATREIEAAQRRALHRLMPEELKAWRKALNLTQTDLAALLGVGLKSIARWESGDYTMTAALSNYIRLLIANGENLDLLRTFSYSEPVIDLEATATNETFPSGSLDEEFSAFFPSDDPAWIVAIRFCEQMDCGDLFVR